MTLQRSLQRYGSMALGALLIGACSKTPTPEVALTSPAQVSPSESDKKALVSDRVAWADVQSSVQSIPAENSATIFPKHRPDRQGFTELDWLRMMPPEEVEAIKNDAATISHNGKVRTKQYGSYRTMPDVLGQQIKLPGYVVPIESDDKGNLTEFFFVPFFGACIHVPPPPPNQIVYARLSKPMKTPEIWEAFMLKGELTDQKIQNRVAGSAYTVRRITHRRYGSVARRRSTSIPILVLLGILAAINVYLFMLPMAHRM